MLSLQPVRLVSSAAASRAPWRAISSVRVPTLL
jgi:hypothetical protein